MLLGYSRGAVIDHKKPCKTLLSGKAKDAALDLFEEESPQNNRLLILNNVIATPHIPAQICEFQLRASIKIAKSVIEALEKTVS